MKARNRALRPVRPASCHCACLTESEYSKLSLDRSSYRIQARKVHYPRHLFLLGLGGGRSLRIVLVGRDFVTEANDHGGTNQKRQHQGHQTAGLR